MLSYILAVLAAAANAVSSVLQRAANRRIPRSQNMSWRLIWSLAHQPVWFGGVLMITIGFLLQGGQASRGGGSGSTLRTALLAIAAGSAFGLTAALMKGMTARFSHGVGATLGDWQLYAMIVTGVLGMFLTQSAMNAGRLIAAQPGLTLSDPIVSVLWGVLVFHERVRGGWFAIPEVAAGAIVVAGVIALARSPLLSAGR